MVIFIKGGLGVDSSMEKGFTNIQLEMPTKDSLSMTTNMDMG